MRGMYKTRWGRDMALGFWAMVLSVVPTGCLSRAMEERDGVSVFHVRHDEEKTITQRGPCVLIINTD